MATLTKVKFLTEREASDLKALCITALPDRPAAAILLGYITGARSCELLALKKKHLVDGAVILYGRKGSNDREIPLPEYLFNYLSSLEGDVLFPFSYSTLRRAWVMFRPNPSRSFHSLRHSCAIHLYKRTKDIRMVKYVLGHRDIKNTMIYADYVYAQEELREAML